MKPSIFALAAILTLQTACATLLNPDGEPRSNRWSAQARLHRPISGDVALGMDRDAVRSEWGDPRRVQVAGDRESGNERWIYQLGPSEQWGTSRIVYFENGRVSGWETDSDL